MLNSMWSGVSGLQTHQADLDVIGNDIANVNTIAFKQSNVSFKDTLYKNVAGQQIGLGSSIGSITQDFKGGVMNETAVETNLALSGDGFFVLKDAAGSQTSYSRAGDFQFSYDSASDTVSLGTVGGKYLYGTAGASGGTASTRIELPANMQELTISREGVISYVDVNGALVEDAYTIDIANFANPNGLSQDGGNQFLETSKSGSVSFEPTDTQIIQGYVENSNVDLSREFTEMIMAERGFQANSRMVTTSDSILEELLNMKR